jgi:transcriptional regulator with XRE-family HTH domain
MVKTVLSKGANGMYRKLTMDERLKDLRVVDKHLTLEQLAEQTGLSKSALGKYESDDCKDISPFALAKLANYYGVSTDYLLGLSENKNHPNAELQALHLSDEMISVLESGKINNRLLCEIATHENFRRLMTDIEIFVDRIADMRIDQMNLVLEATRQEILQRQSQAADENDLYVRTLELGQVQESDFFSHVVHDDLDSILRDVRAAHVDDRTTADAQPTLAEYEQKFRQTMQLGSGEERVIHEFCDKMQIPYEKISSADFSAFMRILSMSKLLKNPNSQRGKGRPCPHGAKRKTK